KAGTFAFLNSLAMHFATGVPTQGPLSICACCAWPAGVNVIVTCPSPFWAFVTLHFWRLTSVIADAAACLSKSVPDGAGASSLAAGSEVVAVAAGFFFFGAASALFGTVARSTTAAAMQR